MFWSPPPLIILFPPFRQVPIVNKRSVSCWQIIWNQKMKEIWIFKKVIHKVFLCRFGAKLPNSVNFYGCISTIIGWISVSKFFTYKSVVLFKIQVIRKFISKICKKRKRNFNSGSIANFHTKRQVHFRVSNSWIHAFL